MQIKKFSFIGLLLTLAALFIILPIARYYELVNEFLRLSFTSIIFFSVYTLVENRIYFWLSILLAVPSIIVHWISALDIYIAAQIIDLIFSLLFYSYVTYIILLHIFHRREVTANVVFGASCVYLLLGLIWALAFILLEQIQPGSFSGIPASIQSINPAEQVNILMESFFYYSYITLTTLGYGNIFPASVAANALSSSEAVVGQLYLTVLIARFVGLHITQHSSQS